MIYIYFSGKPRRKLSYEMFFCWRPFIKLVDYKLDKMFGACYIFFEILNTYHEWLTWKDHSAVLHSKTSSASDYIFIKWTQSSWFANCVNPYHILKALLEIINTVTGQQESKILTYTYQC